MRRLNVVLSAVIIAVMNSCGFPCKQPETYLISELAKSYFSFPLEGSYWVFQNSSDAMDIDTLFLIQRETDYYFQYTEQPCDGDYNEYVNYKLLGKNKKDTIRVSVTTHNNLDFYGMHGSYHNLSLSFFFEVDKHQQTFLAVPDYTLEIFDSYSVSNTVFTNVVKRASTNSNHKQTFCYAKDVGMIEFSIQEENGSTLKSYRIKDYHIVK
ncbi:MAG: hypothetical protein ACK5KP_02095 [Paludibacteraceae bacterium]